MPAIITNKFRMNNAEQFQESFSETAATVYYLGIGRAQSYGTLTRPDGRTDYEGTETAPTTPGDSCLLYTSPSPRDKRQSRMPSSA